MQREPGLGASDTLLAVTTLSFDIAGLELFLPLISGARVIIAGQRSGCGRGTPLVAVEVLRCNRDAGDSGYLAAFAGGRLDRQPRT